MDNPATTTSGIADINMTPLIDVLLVLIVIFMVLTPLTPMGLPASIPQSAAGSVNEQDPSLSLVITVERGGMLYLNREPLERADLPDRLREIFRNAARPVLFVQGEADLEFREVAQVIDQAHGAGVSHIGLMTREAR